jgi:acetyl-CoA acyltransferase
MGAGVESMTFVPMGGHTPRPHPVFSRTNPDMYISMGITAENVANRYNVSRADQDKFAAESQAKATRARDNGLFTEIIPTPANKYLKQADGTYKKEQFIVEHDDGIRATTVEGLAKLRPAFAAGGSVTAGNSSQTTDGAAATIIASPEKCKELGLEPMARLVSYATIGCKSDEMGVGPRYAIPKVLEQAGLTIDDIDIYEINEAFASQAIYSIREIGIEKYMNRINIHGGAIALGHPLGCTGAKLTATCIANLKEVKGKYGIVSMCIGGGMGAAAIFERL